MDRRAVVGAAGSAYRLMRRAGQAAFHLARSRWPAAWRWCVLCGPGNNGGDGLVVARLAHDAGIDLRVLYLPPRGEPSPAAAQAMADLVATGLTIHRVDGSDPGAARRLIVDGQTDLLIDALFGIGLDSAPVGPAGALIDASNDFDGPILSLDVPSGVDADRGHAPGAAIAADATISFIAAKFGLYTGRGRALCGERIEHDLDVPCAISESLEPVARCFSESALARLLPERRLDASKSDFGQALLIGGDHGMGGALCLAVEAALRAGVGRLSAWTRDEHVPVILQRRPECMARASDHFDAGAMTPATTAIGVGPGLGRNHWGREALQFAIRSGLPLLLDADALNLLAESGSAQWQGDRQVVLTPHAGEAARLLGVERFEVDADRLAAVERLAERYRATVVLKGAGSLVAAPDRATQLIDAGNPGMASGGMGDALSGVIAALLAQGFHAMDAASAGTLIHALAGDAAAGDGGQRGLLASDLMPHIRRLSNPTAVHIHDLGGADPRNGSSEHSLDD